VISLKSNMKVKLVDKKKEAKGTVSFFFEPENNINWYAGQYYYFTFPELKYPDDRGTTRHFTISSSPTEGKLIRLTTRIRDKSGFKQSLNELPVGKTLEGAGPNGTFVLDEKEEGPHFFVAGGIGITPFRSMIKYVVDKALGTPIYMIYSNSVPEEIAFKKELDEISSKFPNIHIEYTISKPGESKEKWTGRSGRIDENMLKDLLKKFSLDKDGVTWWVCGPPPMIDAMEEVLEKMKISSDIIRTEKFTGY
jgi:ferredoxin-NADP reductase